MPSPFLFPRRRARWAAAVCALLAAGCSFVPTYQRPPAPIPASFPGAAADSAQSLPAADIAWQDFVQDTRLRAIVARALDGNRDLRIAALAIEQARAQYQIRSADRTPTINLVANASRQPAASGSGSISSLYSVGLGLASWEIDVFGRIASLEASALAQFFATEEARNAVQTSLVAAIANAWLSLQTNDALLGLTERTLATREDSLRLTQLRFDQGVSSALDLRQAQSLTAAARATLAQQQRLRALDVNALTLLVGAPLPDDLLHSGAEAAVALAAVPAGLPSDLLTRRPDVRQAEQQLRAANAQIGAARAAFFPRIALTASAGTASTALSGLFKGGSWGWTLAPQALLPIFDGGRNEANLQSAQVAREAALAQYEKAIQVAFRETADALAGRTALADQLDATQAQAEAEADRLRLADLRYRNGIASYLDVLDAQRALFATQQALAQIRLARQQNEVALFKALGGGWEPAEAIAPAGQQRQPPAR
jgi:multidrug efflux system outer membrane protein